MWGVDGEQSHDVERREDEEMPDGAERIFRIGRESLGKRFWTVHERDHADFWNPKRWYVVRPVFIYRYAVNEPKRPEAIVDIRHGEAATGQGPDYLKLRVDDLGDFLEARFNAIEEADAFRQEIQSESYDTLKLERDQDKEKNDMLNKKCIGLEAQLQTAKSHIQSLEEALALAKTERKIDSDHAHAAAAIQAAKSAEALRKAQAEHDTLAESRFTLHSESEAWQAAATEAQADAANASLVARDARRRHRAEKKVLLKQIKDLQRRLNKAETAKDLRDQVAHFWQDDTLPEDHHTDASDSEDEDIRWLLDQPLLEDQKRLEEQLCARTPPEQLQNPLTPEQRAFLSSSNTHDHTQRQQLLLHEPPALLRTIFEKFRRGASFIPPNAAPSPSTAAASSVSDLESKSKEEAPVRNNDVGE